jgi:hypothetical protein
MYAAGSGILIDERGGHWPDNSPALAQRLGYREPDFDAPAYTVRNLGFIHVRQHEEGVRVSLRSGTFTLLTLAAALYVLVDRRPRRIVLAVFWGEDWSYAPSPSAPRISRPETPLPAARAGSRWRRSSRTSSCPRSPALGRWSISGSRAAAGSAMSFTRR